MPFFNLQLSSHDRAYLIVVALSLLSTSAGLAVLFSAFKFGVLQA